MRLMMIEVICSLYKPDLEILGLPQVVFCCQDDQRCHKQKDQPWPRVT